MFGVWSFVVTEHSLMKSVSLRARWPFKCIKLLQCTVAFIQSFCFPKVEELKAVKYCCFPERSLSLILSDHTLQACFPL